MPTCVSRSAHPQWSGRRITKDANGPQVARGRSCSRRLCDELARRLVQRRARCGMFSDQRAAAGYSELESRLPAAAGADPCQKRRRDRYHHRSNFRWCGVGVDGRRRQLGPSSALIGRRLAGNMRLAASWGRRVVFQNCRIGRERWNDQADQWAAPGELGWAAATPTWGMCAILEDEPHVLPDDMTGMDAIELTEQGDRLVSGC